MLVAAPTTHDNPTAVKDVGSVERPVLADPLAVQIDSPLGDLASSVPARRYDTASHGQVDDAKPPLQFSSVYEGAWDVANQRSQR